MKKISFDYKMVTRVLIAALFVIAGLSKIGVFGGGSAVTVFKGFYTQLPIIMTFIPTSLAVVVGIMVLLTEIPVAILYALGYKKNWTGGILIGFLALIVIFLLNPFKGSQFNFMQLVEALKHIAIIGGVLATLDCMCSDCKVSRKEKNHSSH